jgi:hypothetical protein
MWLSGLKSFILRLEIIIGYEDLPIHINWLILCAFNKDKDGPIVQWIPARLLLRLQLFNIEEIT